MKIQMAFYVLILTISLSTGNLFAEDRRADKLVLRLNLIEDWSDIKGASHLTQQQDVLFYACDLDPKIIDNCTYIIKLEDKEVVLDKETGEAIQQNRLYFATEALSGGIRHYPKNTILCRMGGPASGVRLYGVYGKYDDNDNFVMEDTFPLFDKAMNCLYQVQYLPNSKMAEEKVDETSKLLFLTAQEAFSN